MMVGASDAKYAVKYEMKPGDRCPYCEQELWFDDNGGFQCGGDGEGICSIWCAINDFGRAVKSLPKFAKLNLDLWIDEWVLGEVGQTWTEVEWDRDLHLRGVREIWNLPMIASGDLSVAVGASTIASGDYRTYAVGRPSPDVVVDAAEKERKRLSELVGQTWGPQARAEHDAFTASIEAAVAKAKKDGQ